MESRILVIYKSKTGFTEQYAKWIAEELDGNLISYKDRKSVSLKNYDVIIYGGGMYAGVINGLGWLKKRLPNLDGKKIAVFAVGATAPDSPEPDKAIKLNFTAEEWGRVKTFYFQGGLKYEKMGMFSKKIMAMVSKKTAENGDDSLSMSFDNSKKEAVYPLTEYCGKM